MAITANDDVVEIIAWRSSLESQFPTLAFHFFRNFLDDNEIVVRVMRRDKNGSYTPAARRGEWYEEAIDPANFPSDGFIARCCLIA